MYLGLCSEYSAKVEKKNNNNNKNTLSKLLHYLQHHCASDRMWFQLWVDKPYSCTSSKNSALGWKILGCRGIISSF